MSSERLHSRSVRPCRNNQNAAMAGTYRDTAVNVPTADIDGCADAVRRIHQAIETLERNPNEKLLLETLLWSLPDAVGT